MKTSLVRCSYCNEIFTSEFFEDHKCTVPINDVKLINVEYFRDGSRNGKKSVTGRGLDGILYELILTSKKAIPLSDDSLQPLPSDEDFTEPYFATRGHLSSF